jgi:hypothetical protein
MKREALWSAAAEPAELPPLLRVRANTKAAASQASLPHSKRAQAASGDHCTAKSSGTLSWSMPNVIIVL